MSIWGVDDHDCLLLFVFAQIIGKQNRVVLTLWQLFKDLPSLREGAYGSSSVGSHSGLNREAGCARISSALHHFHA